MSQGFVTLEDVFSALQARAASLVPETAGYLTLAVGDAAGRLPLAHDDASLHLTSEGAVSLVRRGEAVGPKEAARVFRDVLARLLASSSGSMASLSAVARPRDEGGRGVDGVIEEIEAALIPVNRAAGRRALARLTRDTSRAKEAGKLRKPKELAKPPGVSATKTRIGLNAVEAPASRPAPPAAAPPTAPRRTRGYEEPAPVFSHPLRGERVTRAQPAAPSRGERAPAQATLAGSAAVRMSFLSDADAMATEVAQLAEMPDPTPASHWRVDPAPPAPYAPELDQLTDIDVITAVEPPPRLDDRYGWPDDPRAFAVAPASAAAKRRHAVGPTERGPAPSVATVYRDRWPVVQEVADPPLYADESPLEESDPWLGMNHHVQVAPWTTPSSSGPPKKTLAGLAPNERARVEPASGLDLASLPPRLPTSDPWGSDAESRPIPRIPELEVPSLRGAAPAKASSPATALVSEKPEKPSSSRPPPSAVVPRAGAFRVSGLTPLPAGLMVDAADHIDPWFVTTDDRGAASRAAARLGTTEPLSAAQAFANAFDHPESFAPPADAPFAGAIVEDEASFASLNETRPYPAPVAGNGPASYRFGPKAGAPSQPGATSRDVVHETPPLFWVANATAEATPEVAEEEEAARPSDAPASVPDSAGERATLRFEQTMPFYFAATSATAALATAVVIEQGATAGEPDADALDRWSTLGAAPSPDRPSIVNGGDPLDRWSMLGAPPTELDRPSIMGSAPRPSLIGSADGLDRWSMLGAAETFDSPPSPPALTPPALIQEWADALLVPIGTQVVEGDDESPPPPPPPRPSLARRAPPSSASSSPPSWNDRAARLAQLSFDIDFDDKPTPALLASRTHVASNPPKADASVRAERQAADDKSDEASTPIFDRGAAGGSNAGELLVASPVVSVGTAQPTPSHTVRHIRVASPPALAPAHVAPSPVVAPGPIVVRELIAASVVPRPAVPPGAWTRADDLVARFTATRTDDVAIREAKASLKTLIGLDLTPPPPSMQPWVRPTAAIGKAPKVVVSGAPVANDAPAFAPRSARPHRSSHLASFIVVLLLAAAVAFAATVVLRPDLFASWVGFFAPPAKAAVARPHA